MGNDGRTYQNVASACAAIRTGSLVSHHNHIMPRTEMSGKDATSAANPGLRLAISEIKAIRIPEMTRLDNCVDYRLGLLLMCCASETIF